MPSFDIVSEVDLHELRNAVDQANREVSTRFDFKGTNASFSLAENEVRLKAEVPFQLQQMLDMLYNKMAKRSIDIGCLDVKPVQVSGQDAHQSVVARQGIESDLARKLVKMVKEKKLKVQTAIQGEQLRVTGKKRDDLLAVIAMLRDADVWQPLQYVNFRE